jgi:hypothetical protein
MEKIYIYDASWNEEGELLARDKIKFLDFMRTNKCGVDFDIGLQSVRGRSWFGLLPLMNPDAWTSVVPRALERD